MIHVQVTGITFDRKTVFFEGPAKTMEVRLAPELNVSIDVRTEATTMRGNALVTEEERNTLLTLITAIEERLMDEIQGNSMST